MPEPIIKQFNDITPADAFNPEVDEVLVDIDGTGIRRTLGKHVWGTPTKLILDATTTPLTVPVNSVVYVDTSAGEVIANLPAGIPTSDKGIQFIPLYPSYADNSLFVMRNGNPIAGIADDREVSDNGVAFEARWINPTYGWAMIGLGSTFVNSTVTINASDLVAIRQAAGTTVTLVDADRESMVATLTNVNGTIQLPDSTGKQPGWQTTVVQYGDGDMSFVVNPATPTDEIITFSGQLTTLGKGVFVSVILFPGNKWVIGGGLTGV